MINRALEQGWFLESFYVSSQVKILEGKCFKLKMIACKETCICYDAEGLQFYKQPVFYLFPVRKINQVLKVSQFAKVEVIRVYMILTGLIFSSTSDSELIFPIRASVTQLQSRTADVSCYHPANEQFVVVGGSQDPSCVI